MNSRNMPITGSVNTLDGAPVVDRSSAPPLLEAAAP